jgi:hypothetical protein
LATKQDGTVVGWGNNFSGQAAVPDGLNGVFAIAAGSGGHSLAVKTGGTVVGWGATNYSQAIVPVGLSNAVGVAAGELHSLRQEEREKCSAIGHFSTCVDTNGLSR